MNPFQIASFDIEEHHRIEAAVGVTVSSEHQAEYARRMEHVTRRLLEHLSVASVKATFFIVGEIARTHTGLVRDIFAAGHEIGSHSWDHRRVHNFTPDTFRDDLLRSKIALEDVTGSAVLGFRAPTFSIVRKTGWAVDTLVECGFEYDSSIFPVRHDRYGIPDAPRQPFLAVGREKEIMELPPLTYRLWRFNLPVAGGGYFRLFPLGVMRAGMRQSARSASPTTPAVAMLYFHPWEFDPQQPRLPLGRVSRWRTYVGMRQSMTRLKSLLAGSRFTRAIDVVRAIRTSGVPLPRFTVTTDSMTGK